MSARRRSAGSVVLIGAKPNSGPARRGRAPSARRAPRRAARSTSPARHRRGELVARSPRASSRRARARSRARARPPERPALVAAARSALGARIGCAGASSGRRQRVGPRRGGPLERLDARAQRARRARARSSSVAAAGPACALRGGRGASRWAASITARASRSAASRIALTRAPTSSGLSAGRRRVGSSAVHRFLSLSARAGQLKPAAAHRASIRWRCADASDPRRSDRPGGRGDRRSRPALPPGSAEIWRVARRLPIGQQGHDDGRQAPKSAAPARRRASRHGLADSGERRPPSSRPDRGAGGAGAPASRAWRARRGCGDAATAREASPRAVERAPDGQQAIAPAERAATPIEAATAAATVRSPTERRRRAAPAGSQPT